MFSILDIKPLSVNEGYKGRRFKTPKLVIWQDVVMWMLPKVKTIPEPPYEIFIRFGFSSPASDFDNCVKHFVDCLQKKYGFNDKLIHRAVIEKTLVKKGKEFIQWEISALKQTQTRLI